MTATEQEPARDKYRQLVLEFYGLDPRTPWYDVPRDSGAWSVNYATLADFAKWLDEGGRLARRRPRGAGENVDPSLPLSRNEGAVLTMLRLHAIDYGAEGATVREILHRLYDNGVKPQGRPFNYHITQLTLSKLVGRGLAEADASKKALRYRARP